MIIEPADKTVIYDITLRIDADELEDLLCIIDTCVALDGVGSDLLGDFYNLLSEATQD